MKYVQHPAHISAIVLSPENGSEQRRELHFDAEATKIVGNDPRVSRTLDSQIAAMGAIRKIRETSPGEWIAFEDAEAKLVKEIFAEPSGAIAPWFAWQIVPWARAMTEGMRDAPDRSVLVNGATAES